MNVIGQEEVGHPEYDADVSNPLFILVSHPVDNRPEGAPRLWGKLYIKVTTGSLAFRIYRRADTLEIFNCNYELNPDFNETLEKSGLKISGVTEDGGARIIEMTNHPFFIATGFMPQLTSEETRPHPMIIAFLDAALNYRNNKEYRAKIENYPFR